MSTREEKEKQQQILESKRQMTNSNAEKSQRDKEVIALKAANQMLEDAKENIREKWHDDPATMEKLIGYIDNAEEQNIEKGRYQYNASEAEINNSRYNEVSKSWEEKYQKHLENKGITDEEIHNKEYGKPAGNKAIATASTKKEKRMPKPLSFFKKNHVEADLGNEEDEVIEIDQKQRKIAGHGFIEDEIIESPDKIMKNIVEKVKQKETEKKQNTIEEVKPEKDFSVKVQTFDVSEIPSNVQYDIIPLPSHGECYKGKQERIPVRYLTASDENIISSPNMYANGDLIDVILKRCILDKTFDVDEMCIGDRDAVAIWLRETGYGTNFPIVARNRDSGKEYSTDFDLSTLQYKPFKLKGDENGWFEYKTDNGDILKYKLLSNKDRVELRKENSLRANEMRRAEISRYANYIKEYYEQNEMEDEESELLINAIDSINEWYMNVEGEDYKDSESNNLYTNSITNQMIKYTMAVNENTDRNFIKNYIENMRSMEAIKYREYVNDNIPGVDMKITIQIPESDGGGSFDTFLGIDDTIFINI